jgi:hypothetical protein
MAVGGRKSSGRDGRRAVDRLTVSAAHPDPPRGRASAPAREDAAPPIPARLWRAFAREPLVHFLALAALLFVTYDLLMPPEQEPLVIERAGIDELAGQQAALLGRPLTDAERTAVVERAIDDAVLLREAYRRGLDRDAVVRRHLVQKMRFVLGEKVPAPGEAELEAYLAANRERYRSPPAVTLDHVFYADPARVPDGLLARLQNGMSSDRLGDPLSTLGETLPRYTLRDLMGQVGPEVARRVFEASVGEWQGPMRSERGVHFMRVAEHHPPGMPSFEELKPYLRQDWSLDQQRRATAARLAELRRNYRIVVEQPP